MKSTARSSAGTRITLSQDGTRVEVDRGVRLTAPDADAEEAVDRGPPRHWQRLSSEQGVECGVVDVGSHPRRPQPCRRPCRRLTVVLERTVRAQLDLDGVPGHRRQLERTDAGTG